MISQTISQKLDALIAQQEEMKTLVCQVHILAQTLTDKNAALRAENERLRAALNKIESWTRGPW